MSEPNPAFLAMRQSLVERGLLSKEDLTLTLAGVAYVKDVVAELQRKYPATRKFKWGSPECVSEPRKSAKPFSAREVGSGGARPMASQPLEERTSLSNIGTLSDTSQIASAPPLANKLQEPSSTESAKGNGETCRAFSGFTKSAWKSQTREKQSAVQNGKSSMEIVTTRDLRKFLADVMVDVRNGKVKPHEAQAIAKLSAQINQSLSFEVTTAIRQGLRKGETIETEPISIGNDDKNTVWCDQCDGRVSWEEAAGCKSAFCSLKPRLEQNSTEE